MTGFKNIRFYDSDGISNMLEINFRMWLEDSLMRIGAVIPQKTTVLLPDTSTNVIDLHVWNAGVRNWAPRIVDSDGNIVITPATITVNDALVTGVNINYNLGQVTFWNEVPSNSMVEALHYTNRVSIFTVLELNRRPMIQLSSDRGEGDDYSVFQELAVSETIRTPFIILETFPTGSANPYALGTGQVWTTSRIQMTVVTESVGELSKILDIMRSQSYRTVRAFNTNRAAADGVLPIDPVTGDINRDVNALQYPQLLKYYYADSMYWEKVSIRKFKTNRQDVHTGTASLTVNFLSNPNF